MDNHIKNAVEEWTIDDWEEFIILGSERFTRTLELKRAIKFLDAVTEALGAYRAHYVKVLAGRHCQCCGQAVNYGNICTFCENNCYNTHCIKKEGT